MKGYNVDYHNTHTPISGAFSRPLGFRDLKGPVKHPPERVSPRPLSSAGVQKTAREMLIYHVIDALVSPLAKINGCSLDGSAQRCSGPINNGRNQQVTFSEMIPK